ncbi:MAG TPA: argininosuccinate lyase [Candidatus Sulfomarinibacteraceae bacterium]|nr:argininosuccinate lyase [Candidatus Sulfomarinibacteraceae bacterium]
MSKLWGGRFSEETDALVHRFNASLPFDVRLYQEDIDGSIAWAEALAEIGILSTDEQTAIVDGLEQVRREFDEGTIVFQPGDEDVHAAVERRLTELIGASGRKLHTGRSRNDQVATDFRLWTMRAVGQLLARVADLQEALVDRAEGGLTIPMAGYTHLQHAQPVTWGHWVLSHFWPLCRDADRFAQAREAASVLPLGSGALAGTAYPIDREALARKLGFARISDNSIDGVADRDFALDFVYAAAVLGIHLSRLAEQLILFSSAEFGFVVLSDAYSTGSSIMPQKKNPDTLELTRGKAGRLTGHLMGLLMTLKGLPSAYDKDLQEDKEPVFDAFDTLSLVLPVMAGTIRTLQPQPERMAEQLEPGLLATELADYLVKKGVPFREAHGMVGQVVRLAERKGVEIDALDLTALREVSDRFGEDALQLFDVHRALEVRAVPGGTERQALERQLQAARDQLRAPQPE